MSFYDEYTFEDASIENKITNTKFIKSLQETVIKRKN